MIEWLESLDAHWVWLAFGLLLGSAEMLVPGVFLIWMAGAAILTGLLTFLLPIGLPLQVVIFAVLAFVAVFMGRRYLRANPIEEVDPLMNKRGGRLVGEQATVTQAIDGGTGRVKHGDSVWLAKGDNAAVGDRVQIVGSEGAVLFVEKAADS